MNEEQEKPSVKKTLGIIAGILAAGIIVSVVVLLLLSGNDDDFQGEESLNSEQRRTVEELSEDFIQTAGTFGLNHENYEAEDYLEILQAAFSDNVEDYFLTRANVYADVKQQFIHDSARVNYPESVPESWEDSVEYDHQAQYGIDEENLNVTHVSDFFVLEGVGEEKYRAVNVDVDYTSIVTERYQTATDISWDGSIEVIQDKIPSHVRIVYVQTGENTWEIFELREQNNPHTLVTWSNRDTNRNHANNPQVIDRLERDEPFDTDGEGEEMDIDADREYLD